MSLLELLLVAFNLLLVAGIFIYFRIVGESLRVYLPDAVVFSTASHAIGSITLWFITGTDAARFLTYAASLSFASVVFSVIILLKAFPEKDAEVGCRYLHSKRLCGLAFWCVGILNAMIIALLFSNEAIAALVISAFSPNEDGSLLLVRKAITASTEGYVAPGLIKIVRDVISPVVVVAYIATHWRCKSSVLFWAVLLVWFLATVLGGQRFPVVVIILTVAIAFMVRRDLEGNTIRVSFLSVSKYIGLSLLVFFLMSKLLGRTGEGSGDLEAVLWAFLALFERIFTTVPLEAEKTFSIWHQIGPTHGISWLSDLAILIPGPSDSFASELHYSGGGSREGNAPLFLAIDAWLAFGWWGIVLGSCLFTCLMHFIDKVLWSYRSPVNDGARIMMFLNAPLMYSPFLFLLYGGLVVMVIIAWALVWRIAARYLPSSPQGGSAGIKHRAFR